MCVPSMLTNVLHPHVNKSPAADTMAEWYDPAEAEMNLVASGHSGTKKRRRTEATMIVRDGWIECGSILQLGEGWDLSILFTV